MGGGGGGGGFLGNVVKNPIQAIVNPIGSIGSAVGGAIGGAIAGDAGKKIGSVAGDPLGAVTGDLLGGGTAPKAPDMPDTDPRLKYLRGELQKEADDFRKNKFTLRDKMVNELAEGQLRQMQSDIGGIRSGLNARGMLYGGMRQGAEAGRRAQAGANIAAGTQTINRQLAEQQRNLDRAAVGAGLNFMNIQSNIEDSVMNQAINNMQNRMTTMTGVGSAAGGLIGSAIGRARS